MAAKIIGGVFALEEPVDRRAPPSFLTDSSLCFVNARSALRYLLQRLGPRMVWVPSYLCEAVLAAARDITAVDFYELDEQLDMASSEWISGVRTGDVVLVIDYFGFRRWSALAAAVKDRGAWIVEDAAQAFFIDRSPEADFIVYSPRKFVGVADGGVLQGATVLDRGALLGQPPLSWWSKAFGAILLRRDFDHGAASRKWFPLYQESEREAPLGDYRMSDASMALLRCGIDCRAVRERRIANYRALASVLREFALFADLDEGVVPLGFPIRVSDRDRVREALFREQIYPATHWPIKGFVPERFRDSHRLSQEVLTLPCDQRYDAADMARVAAVFLKGFRGE